MTITIDIIHITFRRIGNLLNYDDRQWNLWVPNFQTNLCRVSCCFGDTVSSTWYCHNSVLLIKMQKSKISLIASPKPFAMGHGCPTGKFPFFFHVRVLLGIGPFPYFFYMKGWQLFYWHVSIILFAMATVHNLWQPLRLMTHWAWTIRIRKHVQTDPHGAKSNIPTGPSSCPEQCGRPWDIQYIFPCLHPTFTTYIVIYTYNYIYI